MVVSKANQRMTSVPQQRNVQACMYDISTSNRLALDNVSVFKKTRATKGIRCLLRITIQYD